MSDPLHPAEPGSGWAAGPGAGATAAARIAAVLEIAARDPDGDGLASILIVDTARLHLNVMNTE